jgi:phospholipid transport system substrate-binding protein
MRSTSAIAVCLTGLALGLSFAGPVSAEAVPAKTVIEKTVDDVLGILRDKERSTSQRRLAIERIAHERFDFRTMSKLVLGRNWKRLDAAERDEFVDEFTTYLANDYGSRIDRYQQEKVAVLGEEPKPRGDVVVKTKIVGGENDGAIVDYRMRLQGEDEWRIIDVVIEGISLVANFRDQFKEVIARGGPKALIEKLQEKNAAAEA